MATETWIVYKTETKSSQGWEERKLMPRGGLTDILWENWDWSGKMPQVGDRVKDYDDLEDSGNGVTHSKDGNWVVTRIHQFSSFDTDMRIVVCYCQYQPVESEWQPINRGVPVDEMLSHV